MFERADSAPKPHENVLKALGSADRSVVGGGRRLLRFVPAAGLRRLFGLGGKFSLREFLFTRFLLPSPD